MASELQTYRTPRWLFKMLQGKIVKTRFKLDAAASPQNALCKRFYTEKENGLARPWVDGTWCNPGFRIFGAWIRHAVEETNRTGGVMCLIGPKGCSQSWFHGYARLGTVYVPDQRISFNHPETGEPTGKAREDVMVYVIGGQFTNKHKTDFIVRPLAVRGLVGTP